MADLTQSFLAAVQGASPYANLGAAVNQWQPEIPILSPRNPYATPITSNQLLGMKTGQAFLSGILGQLSRNDANSQLESAMLAMPSLQANPLLTATPDGVDAGAFNQLRTAQVQSNLEHQQKLEDLSTSMNLDLVKSLFSKKPELLAQVLGISPAKTTEGATSVIPPNGPMKKYQEYYREFAQEQPPVQAAAAARQAVAGDLKASAATFTGSEKARESADMLTRLADQVDAAIDAKAYTGPMGQLSNTYNRVAGLFDSSKAKEAGAQDVFMSILPDVIKMGRPQGTRLTQAEWMMLVKAKPSIDKTPEENKQLNNLWRAAADQQSSYADLLDAVREEGGTQSDANKIWDLYSSRAPLFKAAKDGSISVNPDRGSWTDIWQPGQEYPVSKSLAKASTSETKEPASAPTKSKYSVSDLQQNGYTAKDIETLRSQGLVE